MNFLVVNDDGIKAKGIEILATRLKKYGTVYVVSPDRGRSAASHSVILNKPLLLLAQKPLPTCFSE